MHELPMIRKLGLGDKFPRKLLHVQKTSLGDGLIGPNAVIDMLATKCWVGNNLQQGKLSNVIEVHGENSFIDSGLREKERREERYVKYWKEGLVEEVGRKFSSRKIDMLNEGQT